jgi:hypothetical protein
MAKRKKHKKGTAKKSGHIPDNIIERRLRKLAKVAESRGIVEDVIIEK